MRISERACAWSLTIVGSLGLVASFALAYEKYMLLTNPFYAPKCSVNETFNCTTVMNSPQAEVFGFPNPYMGLIAFSVVVTLGVGMLAGAQYARWLWNGLLIGLGVGVACVLWLMYQSIFNIGSLCPYCMVAWVCTFTLFIVTFLYRRGSSGRHRFNS